MQELHQALAALLEQARRDGRCETTFIDEDQTSYTLTLCRDHKQPLFWKTAVPGDPAATPGAESAAARLLLRCGLLPHLRGYRYIKEALLLCLAQPDLADSVMTGLYPAVSRRFQTTPEGVQRAIRKSIDLAYTGGGLQGVPEFASRFSDSAPSNSECLALLTELLRRELDPQP